MNKSLKKRISAGAFVGVITAFSTIMTALLLAVFYMYLKFLPLLMLSLIMLMPAIVNLLLIIPADKKYVKQKHEKKPKTDKKNFKERLAALLLWLKKLPARTGDFLSVNRRSIIMTLLVLTVVVFNLLFWLKASSASAHKLGFTVPLSLAAALVIFVVIDKWCKYASEDVKDAKYAVIIKNLRSAIFFNKLVIVLTFAATLTCVLGFFDLQKPLIFVLSLVFLYITVFTVMSFAVRIIRDEIYTNPDITIPMPGSFGNNLGIIGYLEQNTGISMRSLWSIKLIRKIIPYAFFLSLAVLWLSTGIVQISPNQQGALYRLGSLKSDSLKPGVHITLPWPLDSVEVYDTETVKEITIGYQQSENNNNLWTESHGGSEYKLLLGGGNELVSMNLRLEYKISDLGSYLKCGSNPEKLIESAAYETVTSKTIGSNLDDLLATDRSEFSKSFEKELTERVGNYDTGLEIVSVVLESIHPPVEVAQIYQRIISAGIEAEKIILEAEAKAQVTISDAQSQYDKDVSTATADSHTAIADANAAVAEFMASVEANKEYGDGYRYYKYLEAITKAYSDAKLVIVGQDIDSSNIYLGKVS